jgi:eukaryotic-like serine/threonine-protein kinase
MRVARVLPRVLRGRVGGWAVTLTGALLALWAVRRWAPSGWVAVPASLIGAAHNHASAAQLLLGLASLLVGIGMPLVMRRLQRRASTYERRRARDRQVMLARVRHRWITGVLDRSLAAETRIRLGLTRRPDLIAQPTIIRHRRDRAEPFAADTPLPEVFDGLGGSLLILGAAGSGKTTALLELARHLLDAAQTDERAPIPVVVNLSSWATRRLSLADWLVDELAVGYDVPRRIARGWVDANEVLPLLDGLDEVAAAHRGGCVEAINTFCRQFGLVRLVVCSRTGDYTGLGGLLQVEEAVEQQALSRGQIHDYLAAAGGCLGGVQAALENDETLWALLSSPLVLNIAALTYQDQPAVELRAPGGRAQRLERLFTAYVERMLTHRPTGGSTPARMRGWLAWLAYSMRQRGRSEFHLDRLTADWLPTPAQRRLAAVLPAIVAGLGIGLVTGLGSGLAFGLVAGLGSGLAYGLSDGLAAGLAAGLFVGLHGRLGAGWRGALAFGLVAGLAAGLVDGLIYGLVAGLSAALILGPVFGLVYGVSKTDPVEQVSWSWSGLVAGARSGLIFGLAAGLVFGLAAGLVYGLTYRLADGLADVLVFGLFFGLVFGVSGGFTVGLADERSMPNEGIHRSARHALVVGLVSGLAVGLVSGLVSGLVAGLVVGLVVGLVSGLVLGLFFGLGFGGVACLRHLAVRGLLACYGFAPLRYVRVLDEATDRLLLRRAGSGYLFVHRLLLEHLAGPERPDCPQGPSRGVGDPEMLTPGFTAGFDREAVPSHHRMDRPEVVGDPAQSTDAPPFP